MEWVDSQLDIWAWFSPFKYYRQSGGGIHFAEDDNNFSEFHGKFATWAWRPFPGNPWIVTVTTDDSPILQVPVSSVAPDNNYDQLKLEIQRIVKLARDDNAWFKQQYGWAFAPVH